MTTKQERNDGWALCLIGFLLLCVPTVPTIVIGVGFLMLGMGILVKPK